MNRVFFPIFRKFLIGVTISIILFSSTILYYIWTSVQDSLEDELTKRGLLISRSIADKALEFMLYNQDAQLNNLIDKTMNIDTTIAYIFVLDKDNIVRAHTFHSQFPEELIAANSAGHNNYNIVLVDPSDEKGNYIRDIAVPINDPAIGTVRIGMKESNIRSVLASSLNTMIFLVLGFLIIGIIMGFVFARLITYPLEFISKSAKNINLDSLYLIPGVSEEFESSFMFKLRRIFFFYDEIDILYERFTEMLNRLQRTNMELQSAREKLHSAEKHASVGVISAGIAHEINNPISGLQNCMRRIVNEPGNVEQNLKYFEMMSEAANRIEKAVKNLLNFSRRHEFHLIPLKLNTAVANSLFLASFQIEKNQISLINGLDENIPLILGSLNHLEQVILNLIINSTDAIAERRKSENKLKGEIKLFYDSTPYGVNLYIQDNGSGISEEIQKFIFEPFYTTKDVGKGTGLGLSISQNIIKQHNGQLNISSLAGEGSIIKITFPVYN